MFPKFDFQYSFHLPVKIMCKWKWDPCLCVVRKRVYISQDVSNCWLCEVFFSIFAQIKSFMAQRYPGNVTHKENRTICFKLGNTWKFTSEIQFTTVNLTEVNNSYYFEGALSLDISFSLRLFFRTTGWGGNSSTNHCLWFKQTGILRNKGNGCTWLKLRCQDNGHALLDYC